MFVRTVHASLLRARTQSAAFQLASVLLTCDLRCHYGLVSVTVVSRRACRRSSGTDVGVRNCIVFHFEVFDRAMDVGSALVQRGTYFFPASISSFYLVFCVAMGVGVRLPILGNRYFPLTALHPFRRSEGLRSDQNESYK